MTKSNTKEHIKKIVHYAELSKDILENNTDYNSSKKLISTFFQDKDLKLNLERIMLRLTVIDSIYSTQMNKRLFGLKDLAAKIFGLSKNDIDLVKKLEVFIKNGTEEEISNILTCTDIGIKKNGENYGVATSLLSKYFYFILGYQFPIYDSLVKDNLKEIAVNKFNFDVEFKDLKNTENRLEYFKLLINFNKTSGINDFNKLDNLCWLYGKVKKGSFSLLIGKKEYQKLMKKIDLEKIDTGKKTSDIIDKKIRNCIKNSPDTFIEEILGEKLNAFIKELEIYNV